MSSHMFARLIFSGLFGLAFAYAVFSRFDREVGSESLDERREKYAPLIPSLLLPLFLAALWIMLLITRGTGESARFMLSMCFGIFAHISIYYIVLILLLPLLRRIISARACAMLWIIPNYLYITQQEFMATPHPLLIIPVRGRLIWVLFGLWLAGFVVVMVWKISEHFIFRSKVLKNAHVSDDAAISEVWQKVIADSRIKKPRFRLLISPDVDVPLSIGLTRRSTRVILPQRSYSSEELELILRHEIVHIGRADSSSKFFLLFCTAMCWFNPLMWLAMKKSTEDLELSCDETVLLDADEDKRKLYAALLLSSAGDSRGFTSCLSASAKTMRHRLKSVVRPPVSRSGALIVGAVFFLLCMTSGYVTMAYDEKSGAEIIYKSSDGVIDPTYEITDLNSYPAHNGFTYLRSLQSEEDMERYLAGLQLSTLAGNYSLSEYDNTLLLFCKGPDGDFGIQLMDNTVRIIPFGKSSSESRTYYVYDGIDWEYVGSLLSKHWISSPDISFPPTFNMDGVHGSYSLLGDVKSYTISGMPQVEEPWWQQASPCTIIAPEDESFVLSFSHSVNDDYSVEVRDMQGELIRNLSSSELKGGNILPLEKVSATYIIRAAFEDDRASIEMEYSFGVYYR